MNSNGKVWQIEGEKKNVRFSETFSGKKKHVELKAGPQSAGIYQVLPYDGKIKLYKLNVLFKTDLYGTTKAHFGVDYLDEAGRCLGEEAPRDMSSQLPSGLFAAAGKRDWTQWIGWFGRNVPEGTTKIKVWARLNLWEEPEARGRLWIEDLSATEMTPDPQWPLGYPPIKWQAAQYPVFSREAIASGCVVCSVNYLRFILPEMPPKNGADNLLLQAFAIPGEYETLSFCVYALRPLAGVKVTASDLVNEENPARGILAGNVQVRKVFYQPKKAHGVHYYLDAPTCLEPVGETSIAGNRTQQFWVTVKVPAETGRGKYCGTIALALGAGVVKNIKLELDVLPVRLEDPGERWFGMYYYGKSREDMKPEVADMREHGMNTVALWGYDGMKVINEGGRAKLELDENFGLVPLMDLCRDAGLMRPALLYFGRVAEQIEKLGWRAGTPEFKQAYCSAVELIRGEARKRSWPEIIFVASDEGYPYLFSADRFRISGVCDPLLKAAGAKTAAHALNQPSASARRFAQQYSSFYDLLLMTCCHSTVCGNEQILNYREWPKFVEDARRKGTKLLLYNIDCCGIHPEAMRFAYGFVLLAKGFAGAFNWMYQGGKYPYDELAHLPTYANSIFAYPAATNHPGGPSIGWEAVREGVKDYKLLSTANTLIAKARLSGDKARRQAADQVEVAITAWLNKIDFVKIYPDSRLELGEWEKDGFEKDAWTVGGDFKIRNGLELEDYDALRRLLCDFILDMQSSPNMER